MIQNGKIFKVYQKKEDSNQWETISTVDLYSKGIEPIKVLNVYPDSSKVPTVTFKYLDGATQNLPKSAALKVWMEGGTMNGTSFKSYGKNPITGEQIIKVTPVSNTAFNNNPNIIWNYDIVMFGTWDGSGDTFPNDNAIKVVENYINAGYGIVAGHDTIGYDYNYYKVGLSKLRKYFNIDIGYFNRVNVNNNLVDLRVRWAYLSCYITVNKTGFLTNFPYELPLGAKLTIPSTHSCSNAAKGNVWMTLSNGTDSWLNYGSANNYYNAGGKGNPYYYLTTWNNTAMIQTGHSNGESTDDERKVLANTLFYLKQRTTATSFTDNSSQDLKAPNAPTINAVRENKKIKISYNANDNGSKYSFYVEAYNSSNATLKIATSNQRTETVTTGTKGYYYIIDNDSSNKDFSITANGVSYTESSNMTVDLSNNGKYIHMKAIDVAGNVSSPSVLKININTDKKVNVKLDLDGGILDQKEGIIEEEVIVGDSINLEIPEKEGYSFLGWYSNQKWTEKVTDKEYAPTSNTTLYARWKRDYTITVDNDRDGHTYNSYQIFQGDYSEKEDKNGNKIPILSNIEWGKEFQKEIEEGKTHGDRIIELLKENEKDKSESYKLYTECKTAEDVANVLKTMPNDGDVIREFTKIVGQYILENNIPLSKGTCELVEEKDELGNVIKTNYKITHLEPGYYLVIDAEANPKDDAYSRYLIDVVQDVTMEVKSSIPKLKKKVIGNNIKTLVEGTGTSEDNPAQYIIDDKHNTAAYKTPSENYNSKDYDIEFELKSYIPNPDGYSSYKFEIVDILAKGFDLDENSIKVYLGENEYSKTREKVIKGNEETGEKDRLETVENYTINSIEITSENYAEYKNYFEEEGKTYPENYKESQYGKTLISIEINDLIGQIKDEFVTIGQDVFVRYNSKLNGKGEVGNIPNINEAYLKYSNNPYNNEQITQTTTQTTYTYTIDLYVSKIAELKSTTDEMEYLEGAEFEIYSKPNTVEDREPIATITVEGITDAEGNIISSKGLYSSFGSGTYYLKETKSPEGYNKLREEIEIEIIATCDELGAITWTVEDKINNDLVLAQIGVKEIGEGENKTSIPIIKLQVENTSGFQLPVTGGKGTAIFTITGLIIMLVVVLFIKLSKNRIND